MYILYYVKTQHSMLNGFCAFGEFGIVNTSYNLSPRILDRLPNKGIVGFLFKPSNGGYKKILEKKK